MSLADPLKELDSFWARMDGDDDGARTADNQIIRIAIVDDHAIARAGMAAVVAALDDLLLVAEGASVVELLAMDLAIDVVVLGLRLDDGSTPTENVRLLRAANMDVLVYTSGESPRLMREAARAGALGMIRKSDSIEVLVDAMRKVGRGERIATLGWDAKDNGAHAVHLAPREVEVLRLYASGEKAIRVGSLLGISRETVLDHVRRIRRKYADAGRPARTKIDLYRRALEDGVLRSPE